MEVIENRDFNELKDLISRKRINVNRFERFKIPTNIAFTCEARLEDSNNPSLPLVFFHLVVTFKEGKKKILADFNSIFEAVGMSLGSNLES
jgi:hypothetical protein